MTFSTHCALYIIPFFIVISNGVLKALGGHFETEGGGMDTYTKELLPMEIGHGGSGDVRGNRGSDSLAIYGGSEVRGWN